MSNSATITLMDYLTAPSYHWYHHLLMMEALLVSALTILLCALAQFVYLSDMFQSWPWRYDSDSGRKKFLVALLGVVLPVCWVWFCFSESRYGTVAHGILLNTTTAPITATDGSEKWTVPPDGNCIVTIRKWDVQPVPVLTVQGLAYQVPNNSIFVAIHGLKRVVVEKVLYKQNGDRQFINLPALLETILAKERSTLSPAEIVENETQLAIYKAMGVKPTPDTTRLLKSGITVVGRLGDKLLPPGVSAPDKLEGEHHGNFYEVRIVK